MESRSHAFFAGLFVIVLGVALAATVFWFSRDDIRLVPYVIVTSGSVSGLKVEAPVRYRGVEVGRVQSVRLEPGARGRIEIRIGINEGTPITKSTYAQIGYLGVTGLAFITLNDNDSSLEPLAHDDRKPAPIPLRPSILDSGEDMLASISDIAEAVKSLLSQDTQKSIKRTLDNLERASANAAAASERLAPALKDVPAMIGDTRGELRDISGVAGSVREAADSVRDTSGSTKALANTLNGVASKVEDRLEIVNRAGVVLEYVGASARTIQSETLPRLNLLVEEIARETRSLDRVIQSIGDEPHSLVFGAPRPRPGPGETGFSPEAAR